MGNVTKSQQNNITSPSGNSLALFIDGVTGIMKVKDVMGNIQPLTDFLNYNQGLFAQTSLGDVIVPSSGESSLIGNGVGSLTVPSNSFQVGNSYTAKICGYLSCANNEQIHIRVRANGNIIADAGIFTLSISTNKYFEIVLDFTIANIGGLGVAKLFTNGQFSYNKNSNNAIEGTNFASVDDTEFDTTISNSLSITAEWITSNVANTIQSQNFVLTKVY
jgi:hypothetical protein